MRNLCNRNGFDEVATSPATAHKSWRYYSTAGTQATIEALPDPYDAVEHIRYGPDWAADIVTTSTQLLTTSPPGTSSRCPG